MNLNEQAYDYLKTLILTGGLSAGVLYSETKLAEQIGISRTPLREALVRLSQEGLLDIQHSRGFYLHVLTADDLKDMFQMRLALEGHALIQLAKHAQEPEAAACIEALARNLRQQQELVAAGAQPDLLVKTDRDFHMTMIAYMHNRTLEQLYQNQVYRIQSFARRSFEREGRIEETLAEHSRIVEALQRRDPVATYRAAAEHLDHLVLLMSEMIDPGNSPLQKQLLFRSGDHRAALNAR